jgi:hypothetical protein
LDVIIDEVVVYYCAVLGVLLLADGWLGEAGTLCPEGALPLEKVGTHWG